MSGTRARQGATAKGTGTGTGGDGQSGRKARDAGLRVWAFAVVGLALLTPGCQDDDGGGDLQPFAPDAGDTGETGTATTGGETVGAETTESDDLALTDAATEPVETAEPADTSDPTGPTETTDPTSPTDATDATDATGAPETSDTSDPTGPTDDTDSTGETGEPGATDPGPMTPACVETIEALKDFTEVGEIVPSLSIARDRAGRFNRNCQVDGWVVVGGKDMQIELTVTPDDERTPFAVDVAMYDVSALSGRGVVQKFGSGQGGLSQPVQLAATLPYPGEYLLVVNPAKFTERGGYSVKSTCTANCDRKFTRYPVLLMHGMFGFDKAFGILEYFYKVPGLYDRLGVAYETYAVAAFNSPEARAQQIEPIAQAFLDATEARKLNMVGHSQGGLDARWMVSSMGWDDRVSALVTVATPHQGAITADAVLGLLPGFAEDILAAILNGLAPIMGGGSEQDTLAAFQWITVDYMTTTFNPANPDMPGVKYYSYGGVSCGWLDFDCQKVRNGETVDAVFLATYNFTLGSDPGHGPNDGLVMIESSKWGQFMGEIPADHMDEMGQIADQNNKAFDHLSFYESVVDLLFREGH
jgi:triacylglycerol esterase/lipase EstA (alpha/beta hydrolase family)